MINAAEENRKSAVASAGIEFVPAKAEEYTVSVEVDVIYFFNPFSVEILNSVLAKVLESYYERPRETSLVFYYPSDEYMGALMMVDELVFDDEIDCRDLFSRKDDRERLVIFKVG